MPVYIIIDVKEIMDQSKYGEYLRKVPAAVEKFSGKYLARGGQVKAVSRNWNPGRIVIVEFESMDGFNRWWNSPQYRAIAPLREQSAKTNAIVVEAVA